MDDMNARVGEKQRNVLRCELWMEKIKTESLTGMYEEKIMCLNNTS